MNTLKTFLTGTQMEYMLANGFSMELLNTSSTAFTKNGTQLLITNDIMQVRRWHDGDGHNAAGFRTEHRFEPISHLDEFDWILAMHVFNVIRLEDVAGAVRAGKRSEVAAGIIESLLPSV